MAELDARQQGYLRGIRRSERLNVLWGCALILAGSIYGTWAVLRFDPRAAIEDHASFDRPISSLERLYDPYKPFMTLTRPESPLESLLLRVLGAHMAFTVGILMTLVRLFLGVLVALMGLVTLTVVVERRRLLVLIERQSVP